MTTAYMGIDPGKTGALAVIYRGDIKLFKTPMIGGTGKKSDFDEGEMARLIREWSILGDCYCLLEKASVRKGQGIVSSGNFMMGFGIWRGILGAMSIPREIIPPKKWQKEMFVGLDPKADPKVNAQIATKRLFPNIEFKATSRCTTPHKGFIDALLIAEYGRRKINR